LQFARNGACRVDGPELTRIPGLTAPDLPNIGNP
jgi:hypothetical protein